MPVPALTSALLVAVLGLGCGRLGFDGQPADGAGGDGAGANAGTLFTGNLTAHLAYVIQIDTVTTV